MFCSLLPHWFFQHGRNAAKPVKVLNHLCAVGEVEKMYIPPVMEPCHDFSGLGGFNPSQKKPLIDREFHPSKFIRNL